MASRPERGSTRAVTLAVLALGISLAVLGAQRWRQPEDLAGMPGTPAVPCWVTLGPIDTVTGDGSTLHVRVALDACDAASQEAIKARRDDLEAIVHVVVAGNNTQQLAGAAGIRHLRDALKQRLTEHLHGAGTLAFRDVAIDQFELRQH